MVAIILGVGLRGQHRDRYQRVRQRHRERQWITEQHPPVIREPSRGAFKSWKECEHCGLPFSAGTPARTQRQRFCGHSCRAESSRCEIEIGSRFGRLVVIEYAGRGAWRCSCSCGRHSVKSGRELRAGRITCCSQRCSRTRHGHAAGRDKKESREYRAYQSMIQRCHTPSHQSYESYGGRGIWVCDRWRKSFENFLADMGSAGDKWLGRLDTTLGYSAENCRWMARADVLATRRWKSGR